VSRTRIAGWTHLAVVYRDGRAALYLDGKLDREGLKSGRLVHPAVSAPLPEGFVNYFDGDLAALEVYPAALPPEKIAEIAAAGLPPPDRPPFIDVQAAANGALTADVWHPAHYTLDDGRSLVVPAIAPQIDVRSPWEVLFPEGRGAPTTVTLPRLISLQRHADPGVRFFSGTATYRTAFEVPPAALGPGKKLWLDLGRVAVMAEVRINGRDAGSLWKPPFRIEVAGAMRAGRNELEIRVTNLLANRLIGDESLPAENEYDPRTHAIVALPEWFREGKPRPAGGRTTFSTWRFYAKDDPLVESGLLGPVRLWPSVSGKFEK